MPKQEILDYTVLIQKGLKKIYRGEKIKAEWPSMKKEMGIYSPRVDLAVGPFAEEDIYSNQFDVLMDHSKSFLERLISYHVENTNDRFNFEQVEVDFYLLKRHNFNSRCLMAIEIENSVTRKHLIGSAINAAALGRIGVIIPWTEEKFRALVKMREYLKFIYNNKRKQFDITNLLIISKDQFKNSINQEIRRRTRKLPIK